MGGAPVYAVVQQGAVACRPEGEAEAHATGHVVEGGVGVAVGVVDYLFPAGCPLHGVLPQVAVAYDAREFSGVGEGYVVAQPFGGLLQLCYLFGVFSGARLCAVTAMQGYLQLGGTQL